MSYDISLCDKDSGEVLTLADKSSTELSHCVTYNYSGVLKKCLGSAGIRRIDGMTGEQSVKVLNSACGKLGDKCSLNYWIPAEGNVKKFLKDLIRTAELRPDGVWKVEE